jgi:hypothetical protein
LFPGNVLGLAKVCLLIKGSRVFNELECEIASEYC